MNSISSCGATVYPPKGIKSYDTYKSVLRKFKKIILPYTILEDISEIDDINDTLDDIGVDILDFTEIYKEINVKLNLSLERYNLEPLLHYKINDLVRLIWKNGREIEYD